MPEQVTVGQVAQQAIGRLQARIVALQSALAEVRTQSAHVQDTFRQLLSYCEDQAQHSGSAVDESAYSDIAGKLRQLLDGEQ